MTDHCFVIQPFNGKYNKRYDDVFAPAIRAAGLEPYRVDRDPNASIPIDEIEARIQAASVCFADLTEDNPNVWFELGYSIASSKDLCLVCANDRSRFPFDVQHRKIIHYGTESTSDFNQLRSKITERLDAVMKRKGDVARIQSVTKVLDPSEGAMSDMDLSCLTIIASELNGIEGHVSDWTIRNVMKQAGYNSVACSLSLRRLLRAGRIESSSETDRDGDLFYVYALTSTGWDDLEANVSRVDLKAPAKAPKARESFPVDLDDEIPF